MKHNRSIALRTLLHCAHEIALGAEPIQIFICDLRLLNPRLMTLNHGAFCSAHATSGFLFYNDLLKVTDESRTYILRRLLPFLIRSGDSVLDVPTIEDPLLAN